MRLGILINLAPRKLGSFEAWIIAMCERARAAGHAVDVFGRNPAHPQFVSRLGDLGVGWDLIDALGRSVFTGIKRLRTYDVVHLNLLAPRSRVALMAYAAYPARVLLVDRTSGPIPEVVKPDMLPVAVLRRAADTVTLIRVHAVAGVSDYVRDRFSRRFPFARRKVRTIYNGVDLSRFNAADQVVDIDQRPAVAESGPLRVLAVAYLIRQKGIDHLLRALALASDRTIQLTIVGDGPELPLLRQLADELGISPRARFAGLRDDVQALLAECHVFVHPAVWEEAFGLTIAEAMASGRPVVASRIGGIPELIEHGVSGLLVPPGNAQELAQALDLLARRPDLRRRLGSNARARAMQRFDLQECASEHVRWCEGAVGRLAGMTAS
jgi:L-malate glycosyltransferase